MYKPDARRGWNYHEYQAELRARVESIDERARRESNQQWQHTPSKISSAPKVLQGLACIYDLIHNHKGRKEMFAPGCFDGSLFGVQFHIDHDLRSKKLGDQDDKTLEVIDTPIGLAFRLKLAPGHLDRIGGRNEMSVMYQERDVATRQIGSENVRVIKSASLIEISACHGGAVKNTFAVVRDEANVGLLRDDATLSFPSDSAFAAMQRAMRKLQDLL
jgi:phage head maturation protease